MDFYQQEQVLSPSCSKLGSLPSNGSLDDLFPAQNTEVDVSLEWLSIFVEDCFSSTGNCLPPAATPTTGNKNNNLQDPTAPTKSIHQNESIQKNPPKNSSFMLQKLMNIPGKARSKRKRRRTQFKNNNIINNHNSYYSDTLLLQQSHWLADSELIHFPTNKNTNHTELLPKDSDEMTKKGEKGEEAEEKQEKGSLKISHGGGVGGSSGGGQARRCSHCLAQRTPQWRAGPMGPKTLCNACGVRYKSGRLLPEYRPAKSPTFVSNLHSNSHKKVMEMRMTLPPSSSLSK